MHCDRRAASRAPWTAGRSRAIRTPMMAITTKSSINVKPRLGLERVGFMARPLHLRDRTAMTGDDVPSRGGRTGSDHRRGRAVAIGPRPRPGPRSPGPPHGLRGVLHEVLHREVRLGELPGLVARRVGPLILDA